MHTGHREGGGMAAWLLLSVLPAQAQVGLEWREPVAELRQRRAECQVKELCPAVDGTLTVFSL